MRSILRSTQGSRPRRSGPSEGASVLMSTLSLLRPMLQDIREHHGIKAMLSNFGRPHLSTDNLFPAALLSLFLLSRHRALP
jgi:hypothetical protein